MRVYARINKETLQFIREKKGISYDYISRITKFPESKISVWEDVASEKYPTINQAKAIAKCYHVPFAGFYMNSSDINVKHLPKMRNLRTLPNPMVDDTALNLAIYDVISARDLLLELKKELNEINIPFALAITDTENNVALWADEVRSNLGIDIEKQYSFQSARQFYLYIRQLVENAGVFVHSFTGVDSVVVRGFAIYDNEMPIIGLNNEDRYPAKTFSIIHELVHILNRNSAICNEMINSTSTQDEEIFCNAVAGETLVPTTLLLTQIQGRANKIDLTVLNSLATKFSVSKEVICRRLLDLNRISKATYSELINEIHKIFENEIKNARNKRKLTGKGIPRNITREAIDQNSSALSKTFYRGYREGYFDKQDISRYLGIKQSHIEKFIQEVSRW